MGKVLLAAIMKLLEKHPELVEQAVEAGAQLLVKELQHKVQSAPPAA